MEKFILKEITPFLRKSFGETSIDKLEGFIRDNITNNETTINYLVAAIKRQKVYSIYISDGYNSTKIMYVRANSADAAMRSFKETDNYNKGNEGYYYASEILIF